MTVTSSIIPGTWYSIASLSLHVPCTSITVGSHVKNRVIKDYLPWKESLVGLSSLHELCNVLEPKTLTPYAMALWKIQYNNSTMLFTFLTILFCHSFRYDISLVFMLTVGLNSYAAGGLFGQYKMLQKIWKMIETLTHGYSSKSTQRKLFNKYQHDRV